MHRPSASKVQVMTALLTPAPDKLDELLQTLLGLRELVTREVDCMECVVSRDMTGGARFLWFTAWSSQDALEHHLASEQFRVLLGAANVLGAPTEVSFMTGGLLNLEGSDPPGQGPLHSGIRPDSQPQP